VIRFFGWVGAAIVATALLWIAWVSVHILWYQSHPPRETAFMAQRMDEARARNPKAQLKYQWVPYERISPNLKRR
jgi:monofunctional biosynthetic peptidoglycan transglycosylase